jgi:lipopolysaccharide/colanic/teichoic acid biosynthesis glycosyltransferase
MQNNLFKLVYGEKLKRIIDVTFAILFLIVFSPICILIMIALKIESTETIFFKQNRIGKHQKIYTMIKFRTMTTAQSKLKPNIKTLTRVGRILRSYSLDEVPQFINIIKGEMSIVGPRPIMEGEWDNYTRLPDQYLRRFDVNPGITGLAQISGRNKLRIDEKIKLDLLYVDKFRTSGVCIDLLIMLRTVQPVLARIGIDEI